jgi:hypothetical protein
MSLSHSPAPKKVVSTIKKLDKRDLEKQNQMIDKLNLKKHEIMEHDSLHTKLANEYRYAPLGEPLPNTDFDGLAHKMQTLLDQYRAIIDESESIVPFKIWKQHIHNHHDIQYPGQHGGGVKTKRRHRRVRRSRVRRSRTRRSN